MVLFLKFTKFTKFVLNSTCSRCSYGILFYNDAKFIPNTSKKVSILYHSKKIVQISCKKGTGTKMHKCLVGCKLPFTIKLITLTFLRCRKKNDEKNRPTTFIWYMCVKNQRCVWGGVGV